LGAERHDTEEQQRLKQNNPDNPNDRGDHGAKAGSWCISAKNAMEGENRWQRKGVLDQYTNVIQGSEDKKRSEGREQADVEKYQAYNAD
jgi:hypothetical protein